MKKGSMRFSVLASGSSGNACYVETAEARILIDAGLSGEELIRRMENAGIDPARLDAILSRAAAIQRWEHDVIGRVAAGESHASALNRAGPMP